MITKQAFGSLPDGRNVTCYRIANADGTYVELLDFGATLHRLVVPDRNGNLGDILVGFDTAEGYWNSTQFQGKTIGRYANRIAHGSFVLDGKCYQLPCNENGITCLHGADEFSRESWQVEPLAPDTLRMCYHSADGSCGFPGNADITVTFSFTEDHVLTIQYDALADQTTVFNLTNHAYFNLSADFRQRIEAHQLRIAADTYLPTDDDNIPSGEIRPVIGTPFDFRQGKSIGQDIDADDAQIKSCHGYDHNFCLQPGLHTPQICVYEPQSGRELQLLTDMPGVQLYTGNFLNGAKGKSDIPIAERCGFCLETQYYPDTPNQPNFPQCTFQAGEHFQSTTQFFCRVR